MNKTELLEAARAEILEKTHEQIEEETAWKWAARAIAAFERYEETNDEAWLSEYEDYRHEAIEHAAFADPEGRGVVIHAVLKWIGRHAPRA